MRQCLVVLLGSSFLMSVFATEGAAKSFRTPHGIAFQTERNKEREALRAEPAAGDEDTVAKEAPFDPAQNKEERHDESVIKNAPVKADAAAVPPVPQAVVEAGKETVSVPSGGTQDSSTQDKNTAAENAAPNVPVAADLCQSSVATNSFLPAFYETGNLMFDVAPGHIRATGNTGVLSDGGTLFPMEGFELVSLNGAAALHIWHKSTKGGVKMVSVPVVATGDDLPSFAILLHDIGFRFFNVADVLPSDRTLKSSAKCGSTGDVLVLKTPVRISKNQMQQFLSGR